MTQTDRAGAAAHEICHYIHSLNSLECQGRTYFYDIPAATEVIRAAYAEPMAELERLRKSIMPFAKLATRIPDNWPGECQLRIDSGPDRDGNYYEWFSYHGVNDKGGLLPTIAEWREATEAGRVKCNPT